MTTTHNSPRHTTSEDTPARGHKRSEKNGRALSIERRTLRGLKYGGL